MGNISETEHHTLNYNSHHHQEIIIKNNFTEKVSAAEPLMVVAPEHFTACHQNPAPEYLEKVDSSDFHHAAPDVLEMKETEPKARARSQEKGTASKRAELLAESPILPNTKVGSKLKEILAEKAPVNSKKERKGKGKWDDIMT